MIDISKIESFIIAQGQFCLMDWFLTEGLISDTHFAAWCDGEINYLDEHIHLTAEELKVFVKDICKICTKLNLKFDSEHHAYCQRNSEEKLIISRTKEVSDALSAIWVPSNDIPQMHLFMDNAATIAENQVVDTLANRQFVLAEKALHELTEINSSHKKLDDYRKLINCGLQITTTDIKEKEALVAEFNTVAKEMAPLAKKLLGVKSRDLLAFTWRRVADKLSEQISGNTDDTDQELKNSYYHALRQIPDWDALERSLKLDKNLYQSPFLMQLLAQVYSHTDKTPLVLLMWGLLFERFPDDAESMLGKGDTPFANHWSEFIELNNYVPEKYFIGYLLIQKPGLIHSFAELPQQEEAVLRESVNQSVFGLTKARLKMKDENEIVYRQQLKINCPALLECYLSNVDK